VYAPPLLLIKLHQHHNWPMAYLYDSCLQLKLLPGCHCAAHSQQDLLLPKPWPDILVGSAPLVYGIAGCLAAHVKEGRWARAAYKTTSDPNKTQTLTVTPKLAKCNLRDHYVRCIRRCHNVMWGLPSKASSMSRLVLQRPIEQYLGAVGCLTGATGCC
jgi:hypothetical protein